MGLTGGIASGKTAVSDAFKALGITVVDADIIAREVVAPDTHALAQIIARFGNQYLLADGTLNRSRLRETVFASASDKEWLNQLLHPLIRTEMIRQTAAAAGPYCILSVPLLIENQLMSLVSRVLVVHTTLDQQVARAKARDGSDIATIKAIIASQASPTQRAKHADDIIENNSTLDVLLEQVNKLHQNYLNISQETM